MTDDIEFPRLTPTGDRLPSGNRLFRKAEELTDDQFDLLAASWVEGELGGEALAELESVMSAIPGRRDRAESFRRLRLTPMNESWPGMRSSLRLSPVRVAFRRTILPALMAAAAILVLIIIGPAGAKLKTGNSPGITAGPDGMTVAEIPASHPIIAAGRTNGTRGELTAGKLSREEVVQGELTAGKLSREEVVRGDPASEISSRAEAEPVRALPLALGYGYADPSSIASVKDLRMAPVRMKEISPSMIIAEDRNWILRSISFLAGAVTGKEREIDGYMIANGCITGINTILGWEMALVQVSNRSGDPVAVNFSSSLISFTKPVNKTTP